MAEPTTDAAGGTDVPLTDLLEQTIAVALKRMAGPVIGMVDTYDPTTERASVTPLVPLLVNGELLPSPKLPSVPVEWPSNHGSHSYKLPLIKGSWVSLEPMGHDHSEWLTSGTPNLPPPSERRFSLADLVARPLVPSPLAASPDPLSYHASKAVLFGEHLIGGSDAVKALGLHQDNVSIDTLVAAWMVQVEVFINGLVPGTVAPLSPTFIRIGQLQATATLGKGK